jgi:hypothetical protein
VQDSKYGGKICTGVYLFKNYIQFLQMLKQDECYVSLSSSIEYFKWPFKNTNKNK